MSSTISNNSNSSQPGNDAADLQRARRLGVVPSVSLRRHFIALGRRVNQWSQDNEEVFKKRPIAIGVTGLARRIGKSTVAFNLATALTSITNDQVLLVESDFGKNYISRRLGHAGKAGLSELIQRDVTPEECIIPTPLTGLSVVGSGKICEQLAVELPFDQMGPIIQEGFEQFGFVVFDLPVASDLTSCYSIASHLDGVVITVDARQIDQRNVNRVRRRFDDFGVDIIGLVLNKS